MYLCKYCTVPPDIIPPTPPNINMPAFLLSFVDSFPFKLVPDIKTLVPLLAIETLINRTRNIIVFKLYIYASPPSIPSSKSPLVLLLSLSGLSVIHLSFPTKFSFESQFVLFKPMERFAVVGVAVVHTDVASDNSAAVMNSFRPHLLSLGGVTFDGGRATSMVLLPA